MSVHNRSSRIFAVVPCAGSGSRSGSPQPKQYVRLHHETVVGHTLQALWAVTQIELIVVALAPDDHLFEREVPWFSGKRAVVERCGGTTRAQTVTSALQVLRQRGAQPHDWVLVHDAARCLVRPAWVGGLIEACLDDEVGGLLACPLSDTLKVADAQRVVSTVSRHDKWVAQTPQMFRWQLLQEALQRAGDQVTDEASAVEALGQRPVLVPAPMENFKVTYSHDFDLARRLLSTRRELA